MWRYAEPPWRHPTANIGVVEVAVGATKVDHLAAAVGCLDGSVEVFAFLLLACLGRVERGRPVTEVGGNCWHWSQGWGVHTVSGGVRRSGP
jgi:hypothetical protein